MDGEIEFTVGKWHAANEQHIRESGLAFTFLRPNSFMQNFITYFPPRNGAIYLPWGNGTASFVDTRNIASVAAEVLTSDGHEGRTVHPHRPAALGIAEVAEILFDVAGREFKYVDVLEDSRARRNAPSRGAEVAGGGINGIACDQQTELLERRHIRH